MTYVREQSSEELAAHMRSLQRMASWFDPLADRLWQEVEKLKAEVARSTEREIHQLSEIEALRKDADRYRFLCDKFGETKLPCAIERILAGDLYVADGKPSIDSAIDAAMSKEVKP